MLIFLDAETTGLEVQDKVCSIAIIAHLDDSTTTHYELVNENKKIHPSASSVNHITDEMLKGKEKLSQSQSYKFLQLHNHPSTVIVGHNISFDMSMLQKSGFQFKGELIDTLRVTKHLIPECEIFSLQYLRYELQLYKNEKEKLIAHDALDDAKVTQNLYNYLLDLASMPTMIELSSKKVLIKKFEFGKHKGRYIEEIAMCDRAYLAWMINNATDLDDDLIYSIKYYMEELL